MPDGPKVYNLGNIRLYECPATWITDETAEILRFCFLVGETNVLPWAGGWLDQPRWFIEAYEIYKREILEWKREQAQKQKK